MIIIKYNIDQNSNDLQIYSHSIVPCMRYINVKYGNDDGHESKVNTLSAGGDYEYSTIYGICDNYRVWGNNWSLGLVP